MIAAERSRQVNDEGYAPEGDDGYTQGELTRAAMAYADAARKYVWVEAIFIFSDLGTIGHGMLSCLSLGRSDSKSRQGWGADCRARVPGGRGVTGS